jgi:sugar O-acyltransferase (sialic acid O-acetyltransferase NeuD family)
LNELVQGTDLEVVAIVDNRDLPPVVDGVPMLHGIEGLDAWLAGRDFSNGCAAVAVGGDKGRDRLQLMAFLEQRNIACVTLQHRTAFVAADAFVGKGGQILAQASVCARVRMGAGVIVNTAASVDHDGMLGDGVHLAPGVRLAGEVSVGDFAFIGTGAIVLPGLTIGEGAIVGAGAVVTKNVARESVVAGNPAQHLRFKKQNR